MTPQEIIDWAGAIVLAAFGTTVCVLLGCFVFSLIRDTWRGR